MEYRALATTLNVDSSRVATQLRDVNGVRAVDVFGAANVVLTAPGAGNRVSAPHAETSSTAAATVLRQQLPASAFTVTTAQDRVRVTQRSLMALNLAGLSTIESAFAALIAALGVAVLGAFLVMERRREFAILATIGTGNREMLVGTAVEGAAAVVGSLVVGIPIGLALALLAVRVLGGFFVLPPPLLCVPVLDITALVALVLLTTGAAFFIALEQLRRSNLGGLLRES
jgi:putative ABC transport system permease protein